jgi:hypothetical protein
MYESYFTVSKAPTTTKTLLHELVSGIMIWSVIAPMAILHAWVWAYQEIYFGYHDIPKLSFKEYVSFDRSDLRHLTAGQKIACAYCAYGNGLAAWFKAVVNRTEAYSCAIKHKVPVKGREHQEDFFPYDDFA